MGIPHRYACSLLSLAVRRLPVTHLLNLLTIGECDVSVTYPPLTVLQGPVSVGSALAPNQIVPRAATNGRGTRTPGGTRMPVQTLQRQHEEREHERRHFHYSKAEGIGRRHKRAMREIAENRAMIDQTAKTTTLEEVQTSLRKRAEVEAQLAGVLAHLPRGQARREAVKACVASGIRKAEVARLLGVSPQRVNQILRDDEIPF